MPVGFDGGDLSDLASVNTVLRCIFATYCLSQRALLADCYGEYGGDSKGIELGDCGHMINFEYLICLIVYFPLSKLTRTAQ